MTPPADTPWPALVARLAGLRVLVIGDVSLDEYLYGRPTRLSREAPVPVLEMMHRTLIPGAAANPACNIVALGSHAIQVGIVGDDPSGDHLRHALRERGISPDGLITIANRPTTTKTRIMAHEPPRLPQQVARLDHIDRSPLPPHDEERIIHALSHHGPTVDAILCSDYQMGMLTPTVVGALRHLCQQHGVLLTVDAQGNSQYYQGVDLFRCNNVEAAAALGRPLWSEADYQHGVAELRNTLGAGLVIVTRGPQGLSMAGESFGYTHMPAVDVREVYDTTGAGDTFIAVATLALAAHIAPLEAARLANAAAALTVRKFGNTVVTPNELAQLGKKE